MHFSWFVLQAMRTSPRPPLQPLLLRRAFLPWWVTQHHQALRQACDRLVLPPVCVRRRQDCANRERCPVSARLRRKHLPRHDCKLQACDHLPRSVRRAERRWRRLGRKYTLCKLTLDRRCTINTHLVLIRHLLRTCTCTLFLDFSCTLHEID